MSKKKSEKAAAEKAAKAKPTGAAASAPTEKPAPPAAPPDPRKAPKSQRLELELVGLAALPVLIGIGNQLELELGARAPAEGWRWSGFGHEAKGWYVLLAEDASEAEKKIARDVFARALA